MINFKINFTTCFFISTQCFNFNVCRETFFLNLNWIIVIPISSTVCIVLNVDNNEAMLFTQSGITKLFEFCELHITWNMWFVKILLSFVNLSKQKHVRIFSDTVFCNFMKWMAQIKNIYIVVSSLAETLFNNCLVCHHDVI